MRPLAARRPFKAAGTPLAQDGLTIPIHRRGAMRGVARLTARLSPPVPWRGLCIRRWLVWWIVAHAVSACAQLPPLPAREPTQALPVAEARDTPLGRRVVAAAPAPGLSGLRVVVQGTDALATLITLADQATRTLDLQYYIVHDDPSTRALFQHLIAAAHRGVRVRLLIDDMNTAGNDDALRRMAGDAHIAVRVYNPLPAGRFSTVTKVLASLTDLNRINRRMHNKMFVADNALAFMGGRNLGDAYFLQSDEANFVDLDVLVAGPAVHALSRSFDRYWNSALAYPVAALVSGNEAHTDPLTPPLDAPPEHPPVLKLDANAVAPQVAPGGPLRLQWAPAHLLADDPAKIEAMGEVPPNETMFDDVAALLGSARHEVTIISAYFVPGTRGMALLHGLRQRGVRVRVLTSSLAATDAPAVYVGYARYREPMLKDGIELYELRSRIGENDRRLGAFGRSQARLHAKALVIDGRYLLVGSMNLDPRSANLNSEIDLLVHSPPLAADVLRLFDDVTQHSSYRLALDAGGDLRWIGLGPAGQAKTFDHEPDASLWRRVEWRLLRPFAPDEML
jgi:phosphatidylserine/phosphatidylglycerophosphate/cardiolipin synthase-like enzyme